MKKKRFTFFTSDAAELYKANAFRALALPEKYILQFRYPVKNIEPSIVGAYHTMVNKKGCIFFVQGNNTNLPLDKRPHQIFSVRDVMIRKVLEDVENTGQVYFFLEMGEFKDFKPLNGNLSGLATSDHYVSQVELEEGPETSWFDRVSTISTFFPNQLFYTIKEIRSGTDTIDPVKDKLGHFSRYELDEETDYHCHMQFFDSTGGTGVLKTEILSESLTMSLPSNYIVGSPLDYQVSTLQTSSLDRRSEAATIRFVQEGLTSVYRMDISFSVLRKKMKAFWFGVYTGLAGLGLLLGQIAPKVITEIPPLTMVNFFVGALAVICLAFGAGALYHLFNKK